MRSIGLCLLLVSSAVSIVNGQGSLTNSGCVCTSQCYTGLVTSLAWCWVTASTCPSSGPPYTDTRDGVTRGWDVCLPGSPVIPYPGGPVPPPPPPVATSAAPPPAIPSDTIATASPITSPPPLSETAGSTQVTPVASTVTPATVSVSATPLATASGTVATASASATGASSTATGTSGTSSTSRSSSSTGTASSSSATTTSTETSTPLSGRTINIHSFVGDLSPGAIGGILVAAFLVLIALLSCCEICLRRRRARIQAESIAALGVSSAARRRRKPGQEDPDEVDPELRYGSQHATYEVDQRYGNVAPAADPNDPNLGVELWQKWSRQEEATGGADTPPLSGPGAGGNPAIYGQEEVEEVASPNAGRSFTLFRRGNTGPRTRGLEGDRTRAAFAPSPLPTWLNVGRTPTPGWRERG
ncbi:hypothetical protein M427DRAFT_141045 [Gonapodya prolifera JEL478]|uniref:Uncharacterized protein n=1 Tax=Gonapodya prolifera (strain JEL478) TaxID=1344416 RepID=A0A138ZYW8_GONPJ|nr:hypothetical protein M427DRAFT_141045 [Gonapodya prolifera JEL478]|eukprot:KXS09323.1 hypothetical protein M427DRAFT_141045 [Gonapodya prolifera JEL478]